MTDIRQSIGLPPTETVEFFRAKGYLPETYRENWDGIWQEEHARWFTVTKLFNNQLLEEVRRSLDKVLSEGGTYEQWKAGIIPKLSVKDKNGNLAEGMDPRLLTSNARLRIVYDTNLRMARAAGKWRRIQALKADAPYLMYDAVADGHTRPLHRIWGGLDNGRPIILPVDHPAWRIFFPPCGWGCRCGVIQLSERDLRAQGLTLTTDAELIALGWPTEGGVPVVTERRYKRSTGEIVAVPAGIDPGFAYNPGEAYLRSLVPAPATGQIQSQHIVPSQVDRPPLPAPRLAHAADILPADVTGEVAAERMLERLGSVARDGILLDELNDPIAIDRTLVENANGQLKAGKRGRAEYALLVARALIEPDEIWHDWILPDPKLEAKSGKAYPARLERRYVARFLVDGIERAVFAAFRVGSGGWEAVTWYQPKEGVDRLDAKVRRGTLLWRRNDNGPTR